jgi:hypothetical protein
MMQQPMLAPAAFGGSVIAGVAAMLVSGYRIADCLQYRSGPGACDSTIDQNALPLVAGVAAIAGSFGGFFTYNRQLESPSSRRRDEPEQVIEDEPDVILDPPAEPPDNRISTAKELQAHGCTQQEIADHIGVSRSTVQRLLKS